jgi:two-component system phosphate regulon sensor histidine kinase PhoR
MEGLFQQPVRGTQLSESVLSEIRRVAGIALLLLILGLLTEHVALFLLLGVLAYLAWHVFNLVRFQRWFEAGKRFHPPEVWGVWGDVFYNVYRLQQRNRLRRRRIIRMLQRFQEATAIMPDATVVLGGQGDIEWWNEAAGNLFGLRLPQDKGQRIANLVRHPAFAEFLAAGDYSGTVQIPSPINEQVMLGVRIVRYGKQHLLLVARDITPIYRLDQVRRDFVANVSHELRTPLTVISGFLETMADEESGYTQQWARQWGRSVHLMRQEAARMQHLVEELLLLSRLEMDKGVHRREVIEVANMLTLIGEEATALSGLLKGGPRHRISIVADPNVLLRGNNSELRSAFSNLIFNAVQYTPNHGEINVRWYADHNGAHLEVRDTGLGIPAEHIPRLTERFYRVDTARSRDNGGTGLGLAIVKHVLNRHDAQLRIESELGKGSVFICDFPLSLTLHAGEYRKANVIPLS